MYRRAVPAETHNEDQRGSPDTPQFEGVIFSDGSCAIRWCTAVRSTSVWTTFDDMMRIHGHPEYGSEIEWHDEAVEYPNLEGRALLKYPDADIRCRRIWRGGKYTNTAAIGHLQPPGSTLALCGRMTCGSDYATSDALKPCQNCVAKAVNPR